ncbi:MAG: SIMPL domain-containing protein, partial [Pseudonocardia sp.]|nr:SIMPL domain-containing protein [Pseudonocardia sp.]
GVADEDIQTSRLSISPTYGDSGRITGYEVHNQVTATLRDISAAGALIDAAVEAAGDAVRVQHIAFSLADDGELRARARAEAVRQARTQAEQLAEAAGTGLGPVLSITEVSAGPPIPFAAEDVRAPSVASVPIEAGTQEVAVTVEVAYAIDR